MDAGKHDGWEPTCWDGIEQTIDLIAQKSIKVIVNGGALNPGGLAQKIQGLVRSSSKIPCYATCGLDQRPGRN